MNDISQELISGNSKKIWLPPTGEIISSDDLNNYSISHNYEHIVIAHGTKLFYGS